uniref:Secreted protein n=1 Tax=Setaria italica TaxID=4555 RepID=K3YXB1_SETIT
MFNKFVFPCWWLMLGTWVSALAYCNFTTKSFRCPQHMSSNFTAGEAFQSVLLCIGEHVIFHQKYTSQSYKYNINFKLI